MRFRDRHDAGRQLAAQLLQYAPRQPLIVALPRGGVPVAAEVAHALGTPLELLAVRKLGAPGNPELGVGALAEDGTLVLDRDSVRALGIAQETLERTLAREAAELRRRVERYRGGRARASVQGRTVIVVDDGLATGLTDLAAVRALRRSGASSIVVAAPVGSRESVSMLVEEADEVVCPVIPQRLYGVGMWYRDFEPVCDEEVLELLGGHGESTGNGGGGAPAGGDAGGPSHLAAAS